MQSQMLQLPNSVIGIKADDRPKEKTATYGISIRVKGRIATKAKHCLSMEAFDIIHLLQLAPLLWTGL